MAAPMIGRVRIRLSIQNGKQEEMHKYWYLLDYEKRKTIGSVMEDIQTKFVEGHPVKLLLMDCVLPSFEESCVLRDNDFVIVIPQDTSKGRHLDTFPSQDTHTDTPHNDVDLNQSETFQLTVYEKPKKKKKEKKRKESKTIADDNMLSENKIQPKEKSEHLEATTAFSTDTVGNNSASRKLSRYKEDCVLSGSETKPRKKAKSLESADVSLSMETVLYVGETSPLSKTTDTMTNGQERNTQNIEQTDAVNDTTGITASNNSQALVENGSKRKRVRKRKRRKTPTANNSISDSSYMEAEKSEPNAACPVQRVPAHQRRTLTKHPGPQKNQHVHFYSESDTDDDDDVLNSTKICGTQFGEQQKCDQNQISQDRTVAMETDTVNVNRTSSVSDTVVENMSPISVATPCLLTRKMMSNGVSIFVRPKRGPAPQKALKTDFTTKQQLTTDTRDRSVILIDSVDSPIPETNVAPIEQKVPQRLGQVADPAPSGEDYSQCRPLIGYPRLGDKIAYKILELSDAYTPELSAYKMAQVLQFDSVKQTVDLQILCGANKGKTELGKFDMYIEPEQTQVSLCWSLLKDVRLVA